MGCNRLLAARGLTELADRVGVTLANLSVLKNGRGRAIRFSTLTALCDVAMTLFELAGLESTGSRLAGFESAGFELAGFELAGRVAALFGRSPDRR